MESLLMSLTVHAFEATSFIKNNEQNPQALKAPNKLNF